MSIVSLVSVVLGVGRAVEGAAVKDVEEGDPSTAVGEASNARLMGGSVAWTVYNEEQS